jgi:large subunit ribosomal protein L18
MANTSRKRRLRFRRKKHIRKALFGSGGRPRLSVFRSARHIYCQVIDDETGRTLLSSSSLKADLPEGATGGNRAGAKVVGAALAVAAKAANINTVVFDRNGFLYHGRVAALADAAREGGLEF